MIFTLGEMVSMPVSAAYVAGLAPANQRGFYMGLYGMTWSVAFVLGPTLGMAMFDYSPAGLWYACGLLGLVAAGIILRRHRTSAPLPAPVVPAT